MTDDYYKSVVPVNSSLAFTAEVPFEKASVSENKGLDGTKGLVDILGGIDAVEQLTTTGAKFGGTTPNTRPLGPVQSMFAFSTICSTPEELAYLCYTLGRFDVMMGGSNTNEAKSMEVLRSMTPSQVQEALRILHKEGDNQI